MMKRKFDLIMIGLLLLSLAACQATPVPSSTPTPASASGIVAEFYKEEAGRWLSIALPEGWVARLGGDDARAPIVVTDNWEKYQNKDLDKEALGIIVPPLTDHGTPEQILHTVLDRLPTMLTERQGDVPSPQ